MVLEVQSAFKPTLETKNTLDNSSFLPGAGPELDNILSYTDLTDVTAAATDKFLGVKGVTSPGLEITPVTKPGYIHCTHELWSLGHLASPPK